MVVNIYFCSSYLVGFSNSSDEVISIEEPSDVGENIEEGGMIQLEEVQEEIELKQDLEEMQDETGLNQDNEGEIQEAKESEGTESAITSNGVAEVRTWDEFTAALQDIGVSVIDVKADLAREYEDQDNTGAIARSLTINGNGHKIDFGGAAGLEVSITLNAVTEATDLILNDVIFIKGREGHPIFLRYDDAASNNWNIILNGVNSGVGNAAGLVTAPNATVTVYGENDLTASGQAHHFHVKDLEVTEGASLTATSSGYSYAAIYIVSGRVNLRKSASLKIVNTGAYINDDSTSQPKYSHGLYGSISSLNLEENSLLDIDVTNTAYRTNVSNELNMKKGAVFNAKSKYQSAIALCPDYKEGNGNPAKITIAGKGTELNLKTESTSKKNWGTAIRVAGNNSEIHVTDGAVVRSYSKFGTGIQLQGDGMKVHVRNDAEIDIVQEGDNGDNTKAALYQEISGDQNIQIDKAGVKVTKRSGLAPAVRLHGGSSQVDVINGGRLVVHNAGNGIANNGLFTDGSGNQGVLHTGDSAVSFFLDGKGSTVEITADYGPAIVVSGRTSLTAKKDTILILKGQTSSSSVGILSSLKRAMITMDDPMYFDFRNNRPGGGYIFYSSDQSSTFTATNSDLSVWKKGSDLDGVANAIWTKFDYTLSGGVFKDITYTTIPELFHSTTYLGTQEYSRMSVNTASAIIDELRVPTDADKYIHLHASILGGTVASRDAWTDEVYATVLVKDENGEVVCTLGGASVGADDTSKGLSVYNEEARAGIIKILYDPDDDGIGDFLPAGYTVEVDSVDYFSARMDLADKDGIHRSNMKPPIVTVRDVTPPNPVMLDESSQMISTHTKKISGTSEEVGATIRVKVNGKWLTEDSGVIQTTMVDTRGMWAFPLPKLEADDIVAIYVSDNKGEDEVHDVIQSPITSGKLGNINPDEEMIYHDAMFPAKVEVKVVGDGSLTISSAPANISFGRLEISSLDKSYAVSELDQGFIVTDSKATKGKWRLTATLSSELHNSDKNHTIENGLVYYKNESKLILNKSKAVIYEHSPSVETYTEEVVNISDSWNENEGLFLEVSGGSARVGEYGAVIQWTLEDVPSN